MLQQRFHHLLHLLRVKGLFGLQDPGHIPMMRLLKLLSKKPMLNGRERQWPSHHPLLRGHRLQGSHHCGQLGYRLVLKELPWGDPQPGLIGFGDNLNTENRIAP